MTQAAKFCTDYKHTFAWTGFRGLLPYGSFRCVCGKSTWREEMLRDKSSVVVEEDEWPDTTHHGRCL